MPQDVPYSSALTEGMSLYVEKSSIDVKAVMTGTIPGPGQPQKISISLVLSGLQPTADLEVSWQKQPDSWPEAAWICLPFKVDNPKFRLGRIGADVDPVKDVIVDNANYHLWWVNNGMAVYDGTSGEGIGISSPDAPLLSLGEPGEYKFNKRYEAEKPYVYLNLYNNHWRTNFSAWIGNGQRMSARVRIWTFDQYANENSLYTPAMETRVPLQVACSKVKNGKLPLTQPGISLSRKGVALSAFGPNPDGEGIVLRVWEQAGTGGELKVELPEEFTYESVQAVDLRGRPLNNTFQAEGNSLTFDLNAYAPASFVFK